MAEKGREIEKLAKYIYILRQTVLKCKEKLGEGVWEGRGKGEGERGEGWS